jgi:polar amino acid transport system substrate-binding protein
MKKLLQNQKKNKFVLCVLLLALLASLALMAGCGNNDAQDGDADADGQDAAKETLVVGLDDAFAPMGFRDEQGNLVGFDIDLATAVADELGMQVEFKPIDWNAKEMELKAGTIDCVWNGMSITPERQENMALTNKYLNNKIVLMALADSDIDVTSAKELADLKIGTQVDSSALQMLMANEAYESFKDNISEYETYDTAIMDLKAGRVDVIAVDQVLGEYTNNNLGGEMKECTYSLGDDYYVIGFEKSNTELRDKVNDAIKALIDNGKAAEISSKWFGKDIVVFEPIA